MVLYFISFLSGCSPSDSGAKDDDSGDTAGTTDSADTVDTSETSADADSDGWTTEGGDCDDADGAINPAAEETPYDGRDNDCDELTPDDDLDADGHGVTDDCDDQDASAHPGGTEVCDSVDNDCDGAVDEDVGDRYWSDNDRDGYGQGEGGLFCNQPPDTASVGGDCDDADAAVNPGAAELCNEMDDDCDGTVDEDVTRTVYMDTDADGYGDSTTGTSACEIPSGASIVGGDCDDADASAYPGALEQCDDVDNDCDSLVDNDAIDASTWYPDTDADGFGSPRSSMRACEGPADYITDASDCDDGDATIYPGAPELCDSVDQDCDGDSGDGATTAWYPDGDADGHGDAAVSVVGCSVPTGWVAIADDCDDTEATVHPDAAEACNGVDDDCDDNVDEGAVDGLWWYVDTDEDGYGDPEASTLTCLAPEGYVLDDQDCDDSDPTVNPESVWYEDADGDGYGDATLSLTTCAPPDSYVRNDDDCDDADATLSPDTFWFLDGDGDGYGNIDINANSCTALHGYVRNDDDCDDTDASVCPGAEEHCDDEDTDCDGSLNDPESVEAVVFYSDADGDGFGDPATTGSACFAEPGWVSDTTDCDPTDGEVWPGSETFEVPGDGVDQDCDGEDVCRDLNCDGRPDLVQTNFFDDSTYMLDVTLYYGDGAGISTVGATTLATQGIVGARSSDVDDDGYPDLLLLGYQDGDYEVDSLLYFGSATGYSMADSVPLPGLGVSDACIEDLDGDGYTDIVLASYRSSESSDDTTSYVYWGSSAGWSSADRTSLAHERSFSVLCMDLDEDGFVDVVTPTWYDGDYDTDSYVWWGSASGYAESDRTVLPTFGAYRVYAEDLDLDGRVDLLFPNYYDGDNSVSSAIYWGSSAGYSPGDTTTLPGARTTSAAIADLDGDGWPDIVLGSAYDGDYETTSYVYHGSGSGYSTSDRTSLSSTYGVYDTTVADVDQDGYPEIVFATLRSGTTSWYTYGQVWWGGAAGYSSAALSTVATGGASVVSTADVNEDGYPDIIWPGYFDGSTYATTTYVYHGSADGLDATPDMVPSDGAGRRLVVVGG